MGTPWTTLKLFWIRWPINFVEIKPVRNLSILLTALAVVGVGVLLVFVEVVALNGFSEQQAAVAL